MKRVRRYVKLKTEAPMSGRKRLSAERIMNWQIGEAIHPVVIAKLEKARRLHAKPVKIKTGKLKRP